MKIFLYFLIGIIIYLPTTFFLKGRFYTDKSFNFAKQLSRSTQRIIDNMFLIKILDTKEFEIDSFNRQNRKFSISQFKILYLEL